MYNKVRFYLFGVTQNNNNINLLRFVLLTFQFQGQIMLYLQTSVIVIFIFNIDHRMNVQLGNTNSVFVRCVNANEKFY